MHLLFFDLPLRPLCLAGIYGIIVYSTKELLDTRTVELSAYVPIVLLSGWALFTVGEALIRSIDVIVKALVIMAIGGLIATPYYLFPGSGMLITVSWLLVFFVPPMIMAWGALGR
ncbi:hypothetical protein PENTCL1PPCAC_13310 [Pristionchus entomophagus]|uniref:Uncharacterized protein n=1 Tax=Pristionchus entomophagus TaxID=358040 RepID=A0AAV5T7R2_9BILA|nr:hypothetical protein PENTCL1PPCAC_13310 [Pristionchus entomophagus]